jgi:15-cis-phytoene synthase
MAGKVVPNMSSIHSVQLGTFAASPLIRRPILLNYGFSGEFEDEKACSAAIRHGSKSFHLASLLLPSPTRQAARALYAFCRHSDDLIDDPRSGMPALQKLSQRLDLIYTGDPAPFACDRAFARTVRDHAVPKAVVEALLEGFAMDLQGQRYRSLADLKTYATCVAASVGVMMATVMGVRDRDALARAADLGIAMQLTNIARDVGEDARNGRLYLPLDWLNEYGLDADRFLEAPRFTPEVGLIVERLLCEAEHHYRLGHAGIESLPPACRHAIRTAALVYEAIGTQIARNGFDSVTQRARTGVLHKTRLLLRGRNEDQRWSTTRALDRKVPPDPAAAMLVEAVARTSLAIPAQPPAASSQESHVGRVTEILLQLHARTRAEQQERRLSARRKVESLA